MIISVYFCNSLERNFLSFPDKNDKPSIVSLAAILNSITMKSDNHHFSFCIDGSGVNNSDPRDLWVLFTFHLENQVNEIAGTVRSLIAKSAEPVTLNVFGCTRGGAAAFLLCKKLKDIPKNKLNINLACVDPLAGNLRSTVRLDALFHTQTTLTSKISDFTDCVNLSRMLVLFTPQFTDNPLVGESAHYPLIPVCPASCVTEVDVTPGLSHSANIEKRAAVFLTDYDRNITSLNDESIILFQRIYVFLQECGTIFVENGLHMDKTLLGSSETNNHQIELLLGVYKRLCEKYNLANTEDKTRQTHSDMQICNRANQPYLNLYHQKLLKIETPDISKCILSAQDTNRMCATNSGKDSSLCRHNSTI